MLPELRTAKRLDLPHRLLPVLQGKAEPFAALPADRQASARQTAALRGFTGAAGEMLLLAFGAEQWVLAGLGDPGQVTRPGFSEALARGYTELQKAGAPEIGVLLPRGLPWPAREAARYAAEAALMAGYTFDTYRTQKERRPPPAVVLATESGSARSALEPGVAEGRRVGEGIRLTRDLINHPAAVAHPDFMLEQARQTAKAVGARFRQIRGEALTRQGYGAIAAVGRAAACPPALAALEYGSRGRSRPTVALVGKGVTFDSGGLDLKSAAGMALMKKDMGGAAVVLGAFAAIAALEPPVHLVAVLGLAENAVGGNAYHPGDILRSKLGLTIEITNTDAEGRVVLADALALARDYRPHYLIDFATLTGACRVALGKELMGLFCDHEPLRSALLASAQATGDQVWPLPLWTPYRKALDSAVADIANASGEPMAGAITAALFLKAFAGEVAWAHLDCYAWSDGDQPLFPKGGSGVGVRLLADLMPRLIERFAHGR